MGTPRKSPFEITAVLAIAVILASVVACRTGDDRQALIEDRAAHSVELLSWADRGDGTLVASLRVQGPVHSNLDVLTVEVQGRDAADAVVMSEWVTVDLSEMVRGTPFETTLFLETGGSAPEGLAILMHAEPTPEIRDRLKELQSTP